MTAPTPDLAPMPRTAPPQRIRGGMLNLLLAARKAEDLIIWATGLGRDPDGSIIADPGVFRDEADLILVGVLPSTSTESWKGQGLATLDIVYRLGGWDLEAIADLEGWRLEGLPGYREAFAGIGEGPTPKDQHSAVGEGL